MKTRTHRARLVLRKRLGEYLSDRPLSLSPPLPRRGDGRAGRRGPQPRSGRRTPATLLAFARVSNVALIESDLSWAELAAIPETYATAWTCLFRNLEIAKGQTLVVRGALSSFGQAAVNLAVNAGARVIATTRSGERSPRLEALGAARVKQEGPDLSNRITELDHGAPL